MPRRAPESGAGFWGRTRAERERLARQYDLVPISQLRPWANNPRINTDVVPKLMKLIQEHGFAGVVVASPDGVIRAGHARYKAVQQLGWSHIPVEWKNFPSERAAEEYALSDNKSAEWADWDHEMLGRLFKQRRDIDVDSLVSRTGFTPGQIRFVRDEDRVSGTGSLKERFLWPPFSVFHVMSGDWPDRKRAWLQLGIQSEIGRNLDGRGKAFGSLSLPERRGKALTEKSVFDPVLCELMYEWFCPRGGQVLDPFSGGSVRGVVCGILGRPYWGCDLGAEQIKENERQADEIFALPIAQEGVRPLWHAGDSLARLVEDDVPDADFVFTCPPYGDLEIYSDDPADLSNMDLAGFDRSYRGIIELCEQRLLSNRFACLVVANYRDRRSGCFHDLVGLTINAFEGVRMPLYNEAILVTALGTLPVRVPAQFEVMRKLGHTHQHVLVFVKGSPRLAAEACREGVGRRMAKRKIT